MLSMSTCVKLVCTHSCDLEASRTQQAFSTHSPVPLALPLHVPLPLVSSCCSHNLELSERFSSVITTAAVCRGNRCGHDVIQMRDPKSQNSPAWCRCHCPHLTDEERRVQEVIRKVNNCTTKSKKAGTQAAISLMLKSKPVSPVLVGRFAFPAFGPCRKCRELSFAAGIRMGTSMGGGLQVTAGD